MLRTRRIVAGVSDSPGNLPALRHAADLARVYDAALTFVHAWLPSGPGFAAWQFPSDPLVMQWQDDAWQRMWHALDTAFGRLRHGRVSRYCLAHAACPVIAVPSPALNRAAARRAHAMRAFRT